MSDVIKEEGLRACENDNLYHPAAEPGKVRSAQPDPDSGRIRGSN